MRIRHLRVDRFRGINRLDWTPAGDLACLIGPGDSTKTTILDALNYVLSPHWMVQFEDSDFYDADPSQPIIITATLGDLPTSFKSDAKYGLLLRGWNASGINDEPDDNDESVLSIRLLVDHSLEPSWTVVNDRNPDGKPIRAGDREKLGCVRLGAFIDRHFSWSRGSALMGLTDSVAGVKALLAEAGRASRRAVGSLDRENLGSLHQAADRATAAGRSIGVSTRSSLRPHLDTQATPSAAAGFSLHEKDVPVRRLGLGTRRLLAMAMQRDTSHEGAVTLVDEVEAGLEPYRLRHLLRELARPRARCDEASDQTASGTGSRHQVIVTSHSPITVGELRASQVFVVRSRDGETRVRSVPDALQHVLRAVPEAFLSRRVIVCEGKTEIGLCRRLDEVWGGEGSSFAVLGVALAHGEGSDAGERAEALAHLGYEVCLFGDSDRDPKPSRLVLEDAGVRVFLWPGKMALEERVVADIPCACVVQLVESVALEAGMTSTRDAVTARLPDGVVLTGTPATWWEQVQEAELRDAIGKTAKANKWFKRVDLAERMADVVLARWESVAETPTGQTISALRDWAQGDGS